MIGTGSLLDKPAVKWGVIAFATVAIAAAGYVVKDSLFSSPASRSNDKIFVDSQTGRSFSHELVRGESIPVDAPSGGKTGYPAELCFWTKDGQIKSDPTPVLLNSYLGKPEPTFCPDCGRLVLPNNPYPLPGSRPPPTRDEYEKRFSVVGPELLYAINSGTNGVMPHGQINN
jgi:hypothetical protein